MTSRDPEMLTGVLSDCKDKNLEGAPQRPSFCGKQFAVKAVSLFLAVQFLLPPSCLSALPVSEERQIEAITNQILRKEIDLERYYLQYRVYGSQEPKSRRLRFFAGQVSSAAANLASSIMLDRLTAANIHHPDIVNNNEGKRALRVNVVGILLDGASVSLEFGTNGVTALKNIIMKKSPGAAVKQVIARAKEIDALRAERDALVDKFPESDLAGIYRAEGRVLKGFRDWCLSEFSDVYSDIKAMQSSSNVYYVLDLAADGAYLASALLGLKTYKDARAAWPAVTNGIVGDGLGIASAPASGRSYYLLAKFWRYRLKRKFQEKLKDSEKDAKAAMADLQREITSKDISLLEGHTSVQTRASAYALWSARYDKYIDDSLDDLRHANKVALQGELSGPLISGTYLQQDILAAYTLRHYRHRPKGENNAFLAGSIGATAGNGLSLLLTNYWLLDDYANRWKLKTKKELPEQLLAKRMRTLDELDTLLISASKPTQVQ